MKTKSKFLVYVRDFLFLMGFWMYINSIVYGFTTVNSDKWFSRLAVGLGCWAFWGVIKAIQESKDNNITP